MPPRKIYYILVNGEQLHDLELESYSEAEELARLYRIENDISDDVPIEIWHGCVIWDGDERRYGCTGIVAKM